MWKAGVKKQPYSWTTKYISVLSSLPVYIFNKHVEIWRFQFQKQQHPRTTYLKLEIVNYEERFIRGKAAHIPLASQKKQVSIVLL